MSLCVRRSTGEDTGGTDLGNGPTPVRVDHARDIAAAIDSARIARDQPVLVLVGGAGGMDDSHVSLPDDVLRDVLVPLIVERAAVVVDRGADSGVMRAMGRARATFRGTFPLVGVAARGTVAVAMRIGTSICYGPNADGPEQRASGMSSLLRYYPERIERNKKDR